MWGAYGLFGEEEAREGSWCCPTIIFAVVSKPVSISWLVDGCSNLSHDRVSFRFYKHKLMELYNFCFSYKQ